MSDLVAEAHAVVDAGGHVALVAAFVAGGGVLALSPRFRQRQQNHRRCRVVGLRRTDAILRETIHHDRRRRRRRRTLCVQNRKYNNK